MTVVNLQGSRAAFNLPLESNLLVLNDMANEKMYSLTHILSVLTGGATVVSVTAIEGVFHALNPLYTFLYTSVYSVVIGYYAVSLKANATGITASSTAKP